VTDSGYRVDVEEGYDEAIVRTRLALRAEGFSIVTEMHVGGLLGPEGGETRQYLIMGAWSSPAARRELDSDLEVAVQLPCNVVVAETGSSAIVAALDPAEELDASAVEQLGAAGEARAALARVLQHVSDLDG
jgi:uncharacterized protein (DUF302 family)